MCHLFASFEKKKRIILSVEGIKPQMYGNAFWASEYRTDTMKATTGAQVEVQ